MVIKRMIFFLLTKCENHYATSAWMSNIGSLLIMKVTERRSKSWMCRETHLKQVIKHNARSGLTEIIYVRRCLKSPPAKIIFIYNSFFLCAIRAIVSSYTEVLMGLFRKCIKKTLLEQEVWMEITQPRLRVNVWFGALNRLGVNSHFQHLPWTSSLASVSHQ